MRLYSKNSNILIDTLLLILSTEEILMLIPEFEKLILDENYIINLQFEDSDDLRNKFMSFRIYDKNELSEYDEQIQRIILENI